MRAVVFLAQLLFWLFVVRLLLRAFARIAGGGASPARPAATPTQRANVVEDLVLDRICRTYVPRSRAISARIGERDEQFCSTRCRDQALATIARSS